MKVTFNSEPFSTKVHIFSAFKEASSLWQEITSHTSSVFFLTEEVTYGIFAQSIIEQLQQEGLTVSFLVLPGGEKIKSLAYLEKVSDFMIKEGIRRDSTLIALGGGALLDIAGFIASIYLRGIAFVSIPTTLLSMVDACLGGKTAINTFQGKNTLGTFYPASDILIVLESLSSLPKKQKQSALAEIIKYALILDKGLFNLLEKSKELWDKEDLSLIKSLIYSSLEAKQFVIEKDPKELGLRRILNFGHTIAHALESFWTYDILHGEAVIIGILIESHLSFTLGFLSYEKLESIVSLVREYDLIQPTPCFSYSDIEPYMQKDKKNKGKDARFVLLSCIGKVEEFQGEYCTAVSKETLLSSLAWYHTLC